MRIQAYRALHAEDVPPLLFAELDTLKDHFLAAFENYPDSEKVVVAAWATTGEITGEPIGALVATLGLLIMVIVSSAALLDREGAIQLFDATEGTLPRLKRVWAESELRRNVGGVGAALLRLRFGHCPSEETAARLSGLAQALDCRTQLGMVQPLSPFE